MERRTILAIVLCLVVMLAYPRVLKIFYPDFGQKPAVQDTGAVRVNPINPIELEDSVTTSTPSHKPAAGRSLSRVELAKDETQKVVMGLYELVVSKNFGSLKTLGFTEFMDVTGANATIFLDAKDGSRGVGAIRLWVDGVEQNVSGHKTAITANEINSQLIKDSFNLHKSFIFDKTHYGNELRISYQNKTNKPQEISFYLAAGSGLVTKSRIDPQYFEANWISKDELKHVKGVGQGKIKESNIPYEAVSIKDRHFSSIIKSLGDTQYFAAVQGFEDRDFASYFVSGAIIVEPGETWSDSYLYYAGLNRIEDLSNYELDKVVHFGKMDGMAKLLLGVLQMIYAVVRNYGLAVILLTIGVNILFFPLTRAGFLSMKRMQQIAPQITKLREKYKNDPVKINKETAALYKKYKANPAMGCLPMLAQALVVFWPLYVALSKCTDFLGASFLWAKDLAYPDQVLLPFSLPFIGNNIHVFPLIMAVLTFVQQKLYQPQGVQTDPNAQQVQKMMSTILPFFLAFIFYPMPSGLVIYFIASSASMGAIQFALRRSSANAE